MAMTAAAPPSREPRPAYSARMNHLHAYIVLVAVAGVVIGALAASAGARPRGMGWVLMTLGFACSEIAVVHVPLGRSGFSVTFHEAVLVIGLLTVAPSELLLGVLVGPLLVMAVVQRLAPIKVVFNLFQYLCWAGAASLLARALPAVQLSSVRGWLLMTALTLGLGQLTLWLIAGAIHLADGTALALTVRRSLVTSLGVSFVCTSLGLLAVSGTEPSAGRLWLALPIGGAVLFGHRAFRRLRSQLDRLELLHSIVESMSGQQSLPFRVEELARRCVVALDVQVAQVVLFGSAEGSWPRAVTVRPETGATWSTVHPERSAALLGAAAAGKGGALIHAHHRLLCEVLEEFGAASLIVTRLGDASHPMGVLEVAKAPSVIPLDDDDVRLLDSLSKHAGMVLRGNDVAAAYDEVVAEGANLKALAMTDPVTLQSSRFALTVHLDRQLATSVPTPSSGVVMVGIAGFEAITDLYGLAGGDELLRCVARRLQTLMRDHDVVGRYGLATFALVIPEVTDPHTVLALAERVQRQVARPYRLEGVAHPVSVTAHVGSAVADGDTSRGDVLLRQAELALQRRRLRDMVRPERHGGLS